MSPVYYVNDVSGRTKRPSAEEDYQNKLPYYEKMLGFIKLQCEKCTLVSDDNLLFTKRYRLEAPSGEIYYISMDPLVIEVQAVPMTLENTKKNANEIQALIFDSAIEAGLIPGQQEGGGHISFDLESTFETAEQLRDFFVESYNHPEIWEVLGRINALSVNRNNAPFIQELGKKQNEAFFAVIGAFDSGEIQGKSNLIKALLKLVFHTTPFSDHIPEKMQAVNIVEALSGGRIELRSVESQFDVQIYIAELEFLESWFTSIRSRTSRALLEKKEPSFDRKEAYERFVNFAASDPIINKNAVQTIITYRKTASKRTSAYLKKTGSLHLGVRCRTVFLKVFAPRVSGNELDVFW